MLVCVRVGELFDILEVARNRMAVWELGSSSMYKYLTSRKVIKIFLFTKSLGYAKISKRNFILSSEFPVKDNKNN